MPFQKDKPFWNAENRHPSWGTSQPHHKPTEDATMRDIVWAAGIYEGEGTCGLTRRHVKPQANLRISQKDAWLCQRLYALFGGSCKAYSLRANSAKNPDERRMYWRWDLYGSRALGFLQTIYVLLSPRRQAQIRVVLDGVRST